VLHADEDGLTIVRVTKFPKQGESVDINDVPPLGVIEIRRSVPKLIPFICRYRRDEGDVFFHMSPNVSKQGREWLTTSQSPSVGSPPVSTIDG
jgi:hypothetical protein